MIHIFIVSSTGRHITPPIMHRRIYSEPSLKKKMPHRHKSLPCFYFVCAGGGYIHLPVEYKEHCNSESKIGTY